MSILVTGGAGYIGSHVVKQLLEQGYQPIIVDNLKNGHEQAVLGGKLIEGNFGDKELLTSIFSEHEIEAVIHLAADCLVGEAEDKPLAYYRNNVVNGLKLLEAMAESNVNNLVFSSSAAVYGNVAEGQIPIKEGTTKHPTNAYGKTKLYFEQMLRDQSRATELRFVSLRYFNAAGADPSGKIGEDHLPETHLIPIVLQTALGQRGQLDIYGTDYDTRDGTCVRDYVHVNDLAQAHILALDALEQKKIRSEAYNLGSGSGFSVKEVIETSERVTGREIKAEASDSRPGDPARLVASSDKIKRELNWQPQYQQLEAIIKTAWNWHQNHPHGFKN